MKCSELIKELQEFNPDANVTTPYSEDICLSYIAEGGADKRTTKIIFIEWADECPSCVHEYMNEDIRWCSYYDKACTDVEECYQYEEFVDDF